jgi:hypothetical protein
MGELSILTIIVSLAVCSLLVYGIFQYMKIRLTVLEQSHREQAMILQQYIEESSSDIHRLYKMSSTNYNGPDNAFSQGSIILEYANEKQSEDDKPIAYHEPHTIHLDTALFQNKRTNHLIEISSDSENTTVNDSDNDNDSDSENDHDSESDESSDSSDDRNDDGCELESSSSDNDDVINVDVRHSDNIEIHDESISQVKTITVDLGTLQEPDSSNKCEVTSKPVDVLSLLYKKAQMTPLPDDNDLEDVVESVIATTTQPEQYTQTAPAAPAAPAAVPLSAMSVPDLKHLLKELCKNQPEKHAEIQKLKKSELIYAIKQLQQ